MNKQAIETSIKNAVEEITPDIFEQIVKESSSEPGQREQGNIVSITASQKKKKRRVYMSLATIAAAVMLVIGGTFMSADATETFLSIDVNPSIELEANESGEIIEVLPKNDDARELVSELELKGKNINVAVVELVDAMVEAGYITQSDANIVLSIFAEEKEKRNKLQLEITAELEVYFNESNIKGNVHWQQLSEEEYDAIEEKANDKNVSFGKMVLVDRYLTLSNKYTEEELLSMSIDEIEDLLEDMGIDTDEFFDDDDSRDDDDDESRDDDDDESRDSSNDDFEDGNYDYKEDDDEEDDDEEDDDEEDDDEEDDD